jgi:VanZ family protein
MTKLNKIFGMLTIIGFITDIVLSLFWNPPRIPVIDIFNSTHFLCYFILTACGLVACYRKFSRSYWSFPVFTFAFGCTIEALQHFFPGRHPSIFDVASNACGIILAVIVMSLIFWRLNKHIHKLIPIRYGLLTIAVDENNEPIPHPDWVAGGCVVREEKFMCKICRKCFTEKQATDYLEKRLKNISNKLAQRQPKCL